MPADEITPYLVRLLGSGGGIDTIAHLSPQELHQRTLESFRGIALALSRAGPLVVAVEDLHWIDRASEGYLAGLVDAIGEAPILVLTTTAAAIAPRGTSGRTCPS